MTPPAPPEAVAALERVRAERLALGMSGYVALYLHDAPRVPRRTEWAVIVEGYVAACSQSHLVGRRA